MEFVVVFGVHVRGGGRIERPLIIAVRAGANGARWWARPRRRTFQDGADHAPSQLAHMRG